MSKRTKQFFQAPNTDVLHADVYGFVSCGVERWDNDWKVVSLTPDEFEDGGHRYCKLCERTYHGSGYAATERVWA